MVPFVPFAGPSAGLSQGEPAAPGTWREFAFRIADPFSKALAQRIAYGTPPPYAYPGSSGVFFQPAGGGYYGTSFGSFDPKMLLLLGGAVALVVFMSRR